MAIASKSRTAAVTGATGNRAPGSWALTLWSSAIFGLQIGAARLGYGLALPAIRHDLHGNYAAYGTLNTASLAGYLVGALLAPYALRYSGRVVLWSSSVAAVALIASAFAADVFWFGVARSAFGLASGVALVAAAAETLESVATSRRGTASAVMWAGTGVGLAASALGTGWLLNGATHWRVASSSLAL